MIKRLEDLLIEATTNANVPGSLVAGLRKAVDAARSAALPEPPVVFGYDKLIEALRTAPPPAAADLLPPPFDSQEEAQRAAGIWPQEAEPATVHVGYAPASGPYRVCVKEITTSARTIKIGEVYPGSPERTKHPDCWLSCDKDGWVPLSHDSYIGPMGLKIEWRDGAGTSDWRPKPSAIDEMAEPATVRVVRPDTSYRVCVKAHETNVGNTVPVGHVVALEVGELLQQPACWAPCDKDGWVADAIGISPPLRFEYRGSRDPGKSPTDWRPMQPPKVSAIDEMAEQMKRWAAPTHDDVQPAAWFDKDGKIQGSVSDEQLDAILREALADLDKRNGWEAQRKASEEMWSHLPESVMPEEEIAAHRESKPTGIDATLAERGSRYGKFEDHAAITMQLKDALRQRIYENTTKFHADQLEAIDMICHKLGRIVNGDPNYADSWVDIAGYAKLVADRLEGVSK